MPAIFHLFILSSDVCKVDETATQIERHISSYPYGLRVCDHVTRSCRKCSSRSFRFPTLCCVGLVLLVAVMSCAQAPDESTIYGIWGGHYKGENLLFAFRKDGSCEMRFDKGKDIDGVTMLVGTFDIDLSKYPGALTVRKVKQLDHAIHTIAKFNGRDSLIIEPFVPVRK